MPIASADAPDNFSTRLRALRNRLGLSQAKLAELLGTSFASINRWENGTKTKPSRMAWDLLRRAEAEHGLVLEPAPRSGDADTSPLDFQADPARVRLVAEAERLSFAHLANPAFAIETALIDPLPHQRLAVYEHMLKQPRLRFLLADDAGAGKTVMAGLYMREMLSRRLIRRVLVVPPAGLVGNWERELRTLFSLDFRIVRGSDARDDNPFACAGGDRVICSVDTLAGDRVFRRLQEESTAPYDLVIFDEAHKLSADREPDFRIRKTDRYLLAEALAGVQTTDVRWALRWRAQHLLLLTATPHMGKDFPYYCLWRLLEPEVLSTQDAFIAYPPAARAEHFLRRTKEEMVKFTGEPLYPRRQTDTLSCDLTQGEQGEQALYDQTTSYIEAAYNKARILNRSAARLAMSVFQRRLASSTYALLQSLERRAEHLDGLIADVSVGRLTQEQILAAQRKLDELEDPFDTTTADEDDSESGREKHEIAEEKLLQAVVVTSLADLHVEREQVHLLIRLAREVLDSSQESKFQKLRDVLVDPRFRNEKLIVFSEHRDTLKWLVQRLEAMGFTDKVAQLHGGMDWRERDAQVAQFRKPIAQGGAQYLIATDAAGEGINLQFCWLMVNYDIPWNPARLEQRMGRIHRYGQKRDPVIIINLVSANTREGRVLTTLLDKLEKIRGALRSDKVFDVVGRLFQNVRLTEFMTMALTAEGAKEATKKLEGILTEDQVKAIEQQQRRLYGDGGDVKAALPRLRQQLEVEVLQRLLPGFVRQFVERAAEALDLRVDGDLDKTFVLRPRKTGALDPLWHAIESHPVEARDHWTVYRPQNRSEAIFLHPGDPVFETLRDHVCQALRPDAERGAVFIDPDATAPSIFFLAEVTAVRRLAPEGTATTDGQGQAEEIVESQLVGVRATASPESPDEPCFQACPAEHLLLLRGAERLPPAFARFASRAPETRIQVLRWLDHEVTMPLVAEHQHRLSTKVPERETFLMQGFDALDAELAASRARLSEKARQGSTMARTALERVKEQQREAADRRASAVADLHAEPGRIAVGPTRLVATALILPSTDPEDRRHHDANVDAVAMQLARAFEEAEGATVLDVSTPPLARAAGLVDHPGFDLLAKHPDGSQRAIEVKGRAATGLVEVTDNEWARACNLRGQYWLYVVFDCGTQAPRLHRIRDPFGNLLAKTRTSFQVSEAQILEASFATFADHP
ncbi:MAG: helicase-related protein [Planctomycetota bacterium]